MILEVSNGLLAGKRIALLGGQTVLIGRAPNRSDFALPHDTFMSSVHFAVECDGAGCRIRDRKSSNGTFLNGKKIAQAILADGDEIKSGDTIFKVRMVAEDQAVVHSPSSMSSPTTPVAETPKRMEPVPVRSIETPARKAAVTPENPMPPSSIGIAAAPSVPSSSKLAPESKSPRLRIGSWVFSIVPNGWEVKDEFGLQRAEKDKFPSSIIATEEVLQRGISLQQFVESQVSMLRQYLREPRIEASLPLAIPGADERIAIDVHFTTKEGQAILYHRLYARSGHTVGTITLTVLENEAQQIRPAFDSILSGMTFQVADP